MGPAPSRPNVAMVYPSLIFGMAAAAAAQQTPEAGGRQENLGVTATVVRPAEIGAFSIGDAGAFVVIRNGASIEVQAEGGSVTGRDGDKTIVADDGAESMTVTLIY